MTRDEFVAIFTGIIIEHSNRWLPEESTADFMLATLKLRLNEHNTSVRGVLNEREENPMDTTD